MDNYEKLNVLYDMTEQQQAAIGEAIAELIKQNERLESTGGILPKVIKTAIVESMSDTSNAAKNAVNDALAPALESMNYSIEAANNAKTQLNRAATVLTWKMGLIAIGMAAVIIFSVHLAVQWQRSELEDIKNNIAQVDKLKGKIKIQNCDGRPCVEVDKSFPVYGKGNSDIYVLKGVKF
jgi:hypothetical protein